MMNYTQVSTGETLARKQVREVLQAHKGTMARMAAQLGVTRTAVWLVLKGKSKSRRILCACVGEAQRLLEEGQRLLEERREQRACPNCGEMGGEPETIRGEGWSEEVCSKCVCVGRGTQAEEVQPAARERDSEWRGGEEVCPF
jgi:transcriptional regulator with XRE-family HTH domain